VTIDKLSKEEDLLSWRVIGLSLHYYASELRGEASSKVGRDAPLAA
jgi:hypothetical protein